MRLGNSGNIFGAFFIIIVLSNCSLSRMPCKSRIVYHVFDSLERYMCEHIPAGEKVTIFIDPICAMCDYIPKLEHAKYEITIAENNDENIADKIDLARKSNRYIDICGRLYPVYIVSIDDFFTDPIDSISLSHYNLYSREGRRPAAIGIIVDLDKSVFYLNYNKNDVRGRKK